MKREEKKLAICFMSASSTFRILKIGAIRIFILSSRARGSEHVVATCAQCSLVGDGDSSPLDRDRKSI